jgi:transposase
MHHLVVHPASALGYGGYLAGVSAMPKVLQVRGLTEEEAGAVRRLAQSRTEPVRSVERAGIVWRSSQGERVPAIAQELGLTEETVRHWVKRFNQQGIPGLADTARSGRPATYTPEQVGEVITAALTDPQELGQPFASWTLDRLAAYLNEARGVAMKRSRIDEILRAEGLRWRQQETWFGARPDPEFAEKRGRLSPFISSHPKAAS